MRGTGRRTLAVITAALTVAGCASIDPARREYLTTVRAVEHRTGARHLSDQQLVALGKAICSNLAAGRSRLEQAALASSRVGDALTGDAVYFAAIHDFCPSRIER